MPYENTTQLKEDVLFRAGETGTSGVSQWSAKVIDYLNRCYTELATGSSSFLPEFPDDWWWRRFDVAFLILPVYTAGTCTSNGLDVVTFSIPPPNDTYVGARLRLFDDNAPASTYQIRTHGLAQANAVIDTNYVGTPNVPLKFQLMQCLYDIPEYFGPNEGTPKVLETINSPMTVSDNNSLVYGVTPERMEELYPQSRVVPGVPQAFTMYDQISKTSITSLGASQLSTARVRFSHGGRIDGQKMRVECSGRVKLSKLMDSPASIPLVPDEYRHVLADMALTYVMLDKNDDRANAAALGARTTLAAMLKENRRKLKKVDSRMGHIQTRMSTMRGPIRTESGLIIG